MQQEKRSTNPKIVFHESVEYTGKTKEIGATAPLPEPVTVTYLCDRNCTCKGGCKDGGPCCGGKG